MDGSDGWGFRVRQRGLAVGFGSAVVCRAQLGKRNEAENGVSKILSKKNVFHFPLVPNVAKPQ